MEEIRLKYSQKNELKYISHLDVMRCFERAFARARLPIYYTKGYNPHPYLDFSFPLPLGVESEAEYLDIRLDENISLCVIKEKMNEVLPQNIRILDVYSTFKPYKEIASANYIFKFSASEHDVIEKIENVLVSDEIKADKKIKGSKNGETKEVNIKGLIHNYEIRENYDTEIISAKLSMGGNGNLSPVLFFKTILKYANIEINSKSILKTAVFDRDDKEFY